MSSKPLTEAGHRHGKSTYIRTNNLMYSHQAGMPEDPGPSRAAEYQPPSPLPPAPAPASSLTAARRPLLTPWVCPPGSLLPASGTARRGLVPVWILPLTVTLVSPLCLGLRTVNPHHRVGFQDVALMNLSIPLLMAVGAISRPGLSNYRHQELSCVSLVTTSTLG